MIFNSRFKITWDESVMQFSESLPWAMIAFAIATVTCIVVWLIVYFGDCCLGSPMYSSYVRNGPEKEYTRKTRRCGKSAIRLGIMFLAIVVGGAGFWIACTTAGVSFWNILFGYGIVVALAMGSFSSGLQCVGSYILLSLTNKITEDLYLEFHNMGLEGRITAINILYIEMEYIDPNGKFKDHFVPTYMFIQNVFSRNYEKERGAPTMTTRNKLTGLKIHSI
jgi:hypothetical protein